jgi:hypothetical protein
MKRVDAIGGWFAGVYINDRPMMPRCSGGAQRQVRSGPEPVPGDPEEMGVP